jgi:uncharacterized membrane protein YeiH
MLFSLIVYLGTLAFALSGLIAGRVARPDLVGGLILAIVTGLGGGAIRDVCLGLPVSSLRDPWLVGGILVTALLGMLRFAWIERHGQRLLQIADAIGLGIFNAAGLLLAYEQGLPPVSAILLGAVSGCGGSMIRDVLCQRTPFVMLPGELYLSACLIGSLLGLPLMLAGCHATLTLVTIAAATTGIRALSLWRGWRLPTYPIGDRD